MQEKNKLQNMQRSLDDLEELTVELKKLWAIIISDDFSELPGQVKNYLIERAEVLVDKNANALKLAIDSLQR